jgi:CxxC motif-containing protein (DUF1111 family)
MQKIQLTKVIYAVFSFLLVADASPCSAEDVTRLGGDLSSTLPGRNAIQVGAPNVLDRERFERQLSGFPVFHSLRTKTDGLGPEFNSNSCGNCHVNNGRGPAKFGRSLSMGSSMVVKVSLPGLNPDGSPRNVPGVGEQLRDHNVRGRRQFDISLKWISLSRNYPDGTKYELRRPGLSFKVPKSNARRLVSSLRMTPALIGMGLLEAVPEETILALADPDDSNGDGISGRPNYVTDARTNERRIGRFGFRARHTTVEEQSAAAAFHDIGITNVLFPGDPDASGAATAPELSDDDLDRLTMYQALAGVPFARNQEDPQVARGKEFFQSIGCDTCHRMTLKTGTAKDPELSNQTFHPFTDLLLHDMGKGLSDRRPEFSASGSEWRTTPLWGLGFSETVSSVKPLYLHDGRARTVEEAILWHGGEAAGAKDRFSALAKTERDDLIAFLRSL